MATQILDFISQLDEKIEFFSKEATDAIKRDFALQLILAQKDVLESSDVVFVSSSSMLVLFLFIKLKNVELFSSYSQLISRRDFHFMTKAMPMPFSF